MSGHHRRDNNDGPAATRQYLCLAGPANQRPVTGGPAQRPGPDLHSGHLRQWRRRRVKVKRQVSAGFKGGRALQFHFDSTGRTPLISRISWRTRREADRAPNRGLTFTARQGDGPMDPRQRLSVTTRGRAPSDTINSRRAARPGMVSIMCPGHAAPHPSAPQTEPRREPPSKAPENPLRSANKVSPRRGELKGLGRRPLGYGPSRPPTHGDPAATRQYLRRTDTSKPPRRMTGGSAEPGMNGLLGGSRLEGRANSGKNQTRGLGSAQARQERRALTIRCRGRPRGTSPVRSWLAQCLLSSRPCESHGRLWA